MTRIFTLICFTLLFACNNKQKENDLESRLAKLEQENKELKEKVTNVPQTPYSESIEPVTTTSPVISYAFTRLIVEQQEYDMDAHAYVNMTMNFCSSIKEYSKLDNDVKYYLMDQAQQRYLKDSQHLNGHVKSRECFVFSSYEDASKKREEFLVDKE
jgi:hypothetical protein